MPSPPDRRASLERLRSMPSMICSQPVVAEGDIESTGDVWLLRMGGSPDQFEAHAMVGGLGGGVAVGTTMPMPNAGELIPQWASHHSHVGGRQVSVLLAFLTAAEVDEVRVTVQGGADRVMRPIHRHSEPSAAFFLDDLQDVPVVEARSFDNNGRLLASVDLSGMDTSSVLRVVGPDNRIE